MNNLLNTNAISAAVATLVAKSQYTLLDILAMDNIDSLVIKGLGPKRMSQLRVFRMMNTQPTAITADDIATVRKHFANQHIADLLAAPKTFAWFRAVHKEFLTNPTLDAQLASAFSMFRGEDLLSKRIGEVYNSMPHYAHIGTFSSFDMNSAYKALAVTIFTGLIETGCVQQRDEVKPFIDAKGRRKYRTEINVVFDGEDSRTNDPMKGIHDEPGQIISKRVRVKPGGTPYKFNKTAKDYLKLMSSQALELVEIPREEFINDFCHNEKWFTTKSKNFDRILKTEKVTEYADLYESLLGRTLHLSMWFDYRYRGYYEFSNPVFGPHSKSGKYFYQSTVAELQTDASLALHIESAVTLALGKRYNVEDAMDIWEEASEAIIAILLDTTDKYFGDRLYQRRLVQAIDDIESGEPTKFLLAGDNSNGGLQIFSAEFREQKSRELCNVGGLQTPQDSHMAIANAFGVPRDIAKELGQPVFHAGSYGTVAIKLVEELAKIVATLTAKQEDGTITSTEVQQLQEAQTAFDKHKDITATEVQAFLVSAFGPTITNIDKIGKYTRSLYDNYNTSLKCTTLDGLPAQSIGFVQHLEMDCFGLSMKAKAYYRKIKVTSDMPLVLTNTAKEAIFAGNNDNRKLGDKRKATTKMSGTYANGIHMVDGWSMRQITTAAVTAGYAGIQVHDMYLYSGNAHATTIRPQYNRNLVEIEARQPLTTMVKEMNASRNGTKLPELQLTYGDSTTEAILASKCMIVA